ncbi:MAG TPA: DUF4124 domain-containing protein [Xanthomonadaceae bacterium]|jgi:hypothetical protein|nr:DUF4124 domain-containing protein [Xanthomonadaceae bacterium]
MNKSRNALFFAVLALSVAVPVTMLAAPPPLSGAKLYRWVSADGKVHYSDDLPPEALTQAREELSKSNGMTLKEVDRALTPEEQAAAQAKAATDAKVAAAMTKVKQSDQVLLNSYSSEDELKRAYEERISMQIEGLKATRMGLEGQQRSLSSFLYSASNSELSGKPIGKYLASSIRKLHAQIVSQQQSETQIEAQLTGLRQESVTTMAHYRELRAAATAAHTDASPPAAPTAPPKG